MEFNSLIFPAPNSSYDINLKGLYFIQRQRKRSKSLRFTKTLQNQKISIQIQDEDDQQFESTSEYVTTLFVREEYKYRGVLVFFHGNAEDIGMCAQFADIMGQELQVSVLCMEYPGYGIYKGNCTSDQMIKDAHQVMDHLCIQLGIPEQQIIIVGRSIGSGIAVELSLKYKQIRALILLSAFTSLCDAIEEMSFKFISKLVKERFRNIDKMQYIKCPTLLIHGNDDTLISKEHSIKLRNSSKSKQCELRIVDGMSHNYFIIQLHVTDPIKQFLDRL